MLVCLYLDVCTLRHSNVGMFVFGCLYFETL